MALFDKIILTQNSQKYIIVFVPLDSVLVSIGKIGMAILCDNVSDQFFFQYCLPSSFFCRGFTFYYASKFKQCSIKYYTQVTLMSFIHILPQNECFSCFFFSWGGGGILESSCISISLCVLFSSVAFSLYEGTSLVIQQYYLMVDTDIL